MINVKARAEFVGQWGPLDQMQRNQDLDTRQVSPSKGEMHADCQILGGQGPGRWGNSGNCTVRSVMGVAAKQGSLAGSAPSSAGLTSPQLLRFGVPQKPA